MAQVEQASNGKSGGEGKASGAPQTPARRSLFDFARRSLIDRPGQAGQAANGARPKRGQSFQFFFGLILFMVGSQVLLYLLTWLGGVLHATAALSSTLAPRNQGVFLLSGLSWFEFFWFALVALLYYALIKTKILPTDPFGAKARAREQSAQRTSAGSGQRGPSGAGGGKASAVPTVNIRPVTRADRRAAAQERAAREAAAAAKNAKRTKSGQTSAATQSVKEPAARQGEYDAEYERAKAAQRQVRRREAKR